MLANNTPLPALGALTAAAVLELSRASGEPAWLQQRRAAAWDRAAAAELPRWPRTDLSRAGFAEAVPTTDAHLTAVQWDEGLAAQGVVFTTLKSALRNEKLAPLVEKYLGTAVDPARHRYSALHAALWQDGALLYVPKNAALEAPLRVVYTLAASHTLVAPHTLVILERGANATLIEEFVSPEGLVQPVALPVTELFIGDDANLTFCSVQQWGSGVHHIANQRAVFGRNGGLEWISVALGGQVQHIEAEAALGSNGSHVNWRGATFANGTQSLLISPWLRHTANSTDGYMEFKTVVSDSSYSTFDGMIRIEVDTHGTVSRLEEHAIHLTQEARNDSIPGLMIDSNDIARAGHASTSGKIDDEQIFYLQSRGITRADATRMIVMGFLQSVIDAVPTADLQERLTTAVEEKI